MTQALIPIGGGNAPTGIYSNTALTKIIKPKIREATQQPRKIISSFSSQSIPASTQKTKRIIIESVSAPMIKDIKFGFDRNSIERNSLTQKPTKTPTKNVINLYSHCHFIENSLGQKEIKLLARAINSIYWERKMDRKLKIIPKPKPNTRVILEPKVGEVLPVIKGNGNLNLLCGNCNAVLVQGINEGQIRNIVIHCPICRHFNEIP